VNLTYICVNLYLFVSVFIRLYPSNHRPLQCQQRTETAQPFSGEDGWFWIRHKIFGPSSSVCIATDYGLDGPGSNPGDEIFRPSRSALGPTQPPVKGYRVFPGGKVWLGRATDHSPLLVPRSWKSRAITLLSLRAFVAYKRVKNYPHRIVNISGGIEAGVMETSYDIYKGRNETKKGMERCLYLSSRRLWSSRRY